MDIDLHKEQYTTEDLLKIMEILRSENGCPWDRVQTHESIRKSLIEESYEAIDALNSGDDKAFANELGDVLLQVVFHSQIAKEEGRFDYNTVLNEICNKLISRHTHVFGGDSAASAEEALGSWEKNKKKEKKLDSYSSMLDDVPHYLPALMRAEKIQKKAGAAGFDWDDIKPVYDKVYEELDELKAAAASKDEAHIAEEYGDLLFAAVNLGRFLHVTPETALADASDKFTARFKEVERLADEDGRGMSGMTLEELDKLWEKVKEN